MQTQNRFFDDIAKLVGEGVGAAIKCAEKVKDCSSNSSASASESQTGMGDKSDRIYEMVSNSRAETEALHDRIAKLEKELQALKNNQ